MITSETAAPTMSSAGARDALTISHIVTRNINKTGDPKDMKSFNFNFILFDMDLASPKRGKN
ncbi:hypothetical protein ACUSIJ_08495 [Pseudochelatococcus sp. B33]